MSNSGQTVPSLAAFAQRAGKSSTLDNDLDTSLEETHGIWFKRQALRATPPAMSGGSRVAIETDGDYVTVLPHMFWEPVK